MDDDIVIGEGVVLDSVAATVGLRILSGLIDYAVLGLGWIIVLTTIVIPALFTLDSAAATAVVISTNLLILIGVPVLVETLTRGRSLGRLATGIRIVRDDGGPITVRHAFTRALLGVFEIWVALGSVAAVAAMFSARSKRIGDSIAGTYAVRTRARNRALPPVEMPKSLENWSEAVDIQRLPDGLALQARQFLGRTHTMQSSSRDAIGRDLAQQFSTYVAPPPPDGTSAEDFIAAVLAARRDREYSLALSHQEKDTAQSAMVRQLPFGVPDVPH